jgi:hypothetical protein
MNELEARCPATTPWARSASLRAIRELKQQIAALDEERRFLPIAAELPEQLEWS